MTSLDFTIGYNHILRDKTLSLAAKGLYLVISSYIGIPGWSLCKSQLCRDAESRYALEKAWRELQSAGYLKHMFYTSVTGAFAHIYDLLQVPNDTPGYQYISGSDRANGDCRFILAHDTKRDFTRIPNAILRSPLPLAVKGLFGVVMHLVNIPDFHLHPQGVRAFCCEKIKRFSTVWQQLKLSGLLKQHRYPTGEYNGFTYTYELPSEPDQDTPYLTNHHANGEISSVKRIADYLEHAKSKLKSLFLDVTDRKTKRQNANASIQTPAYADTVPQAQTDLDTAVCERIDYTRLRSNYTPALVDMIADALSQLANSTSITVNKQKIPLDERRSIIESISYDDISAFISTARFDLSRSKAPIAYLRSILFTWLRMRRHQVLADNDAPTFNWNNRTPTYKLQAWEQDWIDRIRSYRQGTPINDKNTSMS